MGNVTRILELVKKHANIKDNVNVQSDLLDDLGYDSMSFIKLIIELETEYKIKIEPQYLTYNNLPTVQRIIDLVVSTDCKLQS